MIINNYIRMLIICLCSLPTGAFLPACQRHATLGTIDVIVLLILAIFTSII